MASCNNCSAAVTSHCGGCFTAGYCGTVCQRAHWRNGHRAACPTIKTRCLKEFQWAIERGNISAVTSILARGVSVDTELSGFTPLYLACEGGHVEVALLLMRRGANLAWVYPSMGMSSLYIAAQNGHVDIVRVLLKRLIATRDEELIAAVINHTAISTGSTPLITAALNGHPTIIRLLLDRGAVVDKLKVDDQCTALRMAARQGHTSCVEQLLAGGANVNHQTSDRGFTPIYMAAKHGHEDTLRVLLAAIAGAAVAGGAAGARAAVAAALNARDYNGGTALYMAAFYGRTECAQRLLSAGANPHIPCRERSDRGEATVEFTPLAAVITKYGLSHSLVVRLAAAEAGVSA